MSRPQSSVFWVFLNVGRSNSHSCFWDCSSFIQRTVVCLLNLWRRNNFGNRTGKEVSFSGSHDMGKVIVNYLVMCLKQTKQQVCAVGLFSPMPSAAEEIGMYWTRFGQEYCLKYTLSPSPHLKNWLIIEPWEVLSGLERWMGRGRGTRAGAGQGAVLWRLWRRGTVRCRSRASPCPAVSGCTEDRLSCSGSSGSSLSPLLPSQEWALYCSIPAPTTVTSSQAISSAPFHPAWYNLPPSLRNHQIKVLWKTDGCFPLPFISCSQSWLTLRLAPFTSVCSMSSWRAEVL